MKIILLTHKYDEIIKFIYKYIIHRDSLRVSCHIYCHRSHAANVTCMLHRCTLTDSTANSAWTFVAALLSFFLQSPVEVNRRETK